MAVQARVKGMQYRRYLGDSTVQRIAALLCSIHIFGWGGGGEVHDGKFKRNIMMAQINDQLPGKANLLINRPEIFLNKKKILSRKKKRQQKNATSNGLTCLTGSDTMAKRRSDGGG